MRLSNRSKIPRYNFINTVLIIILILGFLAFFLEHFKFKVLGLVSYLLILIPIILIIMFILAGRQVFEYDSDGEALHFRNTNIIPLISPRLSDEFPKYKLINYDIIRVLFVRRLYIVINSKSNGTALLKYEISYLTSKEVTDLKISLNKIVKNNKENRH